MHHHAHHVRLFQQKKIQMKSSVLDLPWFVTVQFAFICLDSFVPVWMQDISKLKGFLELACSKLQNLELQEKRCCRLELEDTWLVQTGE